MPRTPPTFATRLDLLVAALATAKTAVLDWEASGLQPREAAPAGLGIYLPEADKAFYVNCGHTRRDDRFPRCTPAELAEGVGPFLENPARHAVFQNAPYDLRHFINLGTAPRCRISDTLIHTHRTDENLTPFSSSPTYHQHIPADETGYGLKNAIAIFANERPPRLVEATGNQNVIFADIMSVALYCLQDVCNTWYLYERAKKLIDADEVLRDLTDKIDEPNSIVIAKMMNEGIAIDLDEIRKQRPLYYASIQACRDYISELTGTRHGLDNKRNVLKVMNELQIEDELGYDPFYRAFWNDEEPEVTREILITIFNELTSEPKRQVIAAFLSMWLMKQRISTFCNRLEQHSNPEGRLYLNGCLSLQATTRFSMSPSLQNLPGRADKIDPTDPMMILPAECRDHHKTRNLLTVKPGCVLISFDLSAAEPRYLAMMCQKALREQSADLDGQKRVLQLEREIKYPVLLKAMRDSCKKRDYTPEPEQWPEIADDPLWLAFKADRDPYEALLESWDREGFEQATDKAKWLKDYRWMGKKAFLSTCYGITANSLAPQLEWTLEKTKQAIADLEAGYPMIPALKNLVFRQLTSTGEVRTLWGRPRRMNGYFQLSRPNPLVVQFVRRRTPSGRQLKHTYHAHIIPLGTYKQGVQAFIERCVCTESGQVVLEGNPDGTIKTIVKNDAFAHAAIHEHFNSPPFANISYSTIQWVQEPDSGLIRWMPYQEKAHRILFNSIFQGTGADHLRWLMNNMDREVCVEDFADCKLVLTVHDSLIFEVPESKATAFIETAMPVLTRRPKWATLDIKVDAEVGTKYGEMRKVDFANCRV